MSSVFKTDTLQIEILEDGTIKTTTDAVSGANHANAEQFLKYIATLAGGTNDRQRRTDAHTHGGVAHTHDHGDHDHDHA